MKTLTASECMDWLKDRGFDCEPKHGISGAFPHLPPPQFHKLDYYLPKDSGVKVALSRWIYRKLESDVQKLVWVRNWMVWESSGHVPLLLRLREALGERRSLEEFPGHVFSTEEDQDGISVLIMSVEFFWDCLVVGSNFHFICFISHDGYYSLMTDDATMLAELTKSLNSGDLGTKVER